MLLLMKSFFMKLHIGNLVTSAWFMYIHLSNHSTFSFFVRLHAGNHPSFRSHLPSRWIYTENYPRQEYMLINKLYEFCENVICIVLKLSANASFNLNCPPLNGSVQVVTINITYMCNVP